MLEDLLRQKIQEKGPLSQQHFMELALQHPQHGYYRSHQAIGQDFTTSPEISQVFGEVIGLWALDVYQKLNHPDIINLVELGPGKGTLMADVLRAAALSKAFQDALLLTLVEINPVLKDLQQKALNTEATWVESLDEIPDKKGPLLILANEFFDALPTQCFERKDNVLYERCVTWDEEGFSYTNQKLRTDPGEDGIYEECPEALTIMTSICKRLAKKGGIFLCLDYGYERGQGDTLQALYKGQPSDPLSHVGKSDLTCHVHFGRLKEIAEAKGLRVLGPLAQGQFLDHIGFHVRTEILKRINPHKGRDLDLAALRLTHPLHMGNLFKAMAVFSPPSLNPIGFA